MINPLLVPGDVQVNADGVGMGLRLRRVFAVGSDYPDSFELDPGIVQIAGPCGRTEGLFELTEVDAGGAMIARLDGPNRLVLENLVEGPSSVRVVGTINPTARDLEACPDVFVEGAVHRIEVRYEFSNHRPVGIELVSGSQCDEARPNTAVVTSRLARAPQILLVDEAGNTFIPRNAESGHSAALKVSAPVGTSLEDQALGIAGLRLGERAGDVVIRASFGEPHIVEVIGVERLTGWTPEFQVGAVAGTPVVLESNEAYALRGRASNRVVPMMKDLLMMDGQRVCADLSPSWFSFETLTPETCVIDREPPIESLVLFGDYFGHAAKLIADGACRLVLRLLVLEMGCQWSSPPAFQCRECVRPEQLNLITSRTSGSSDFVGVETALVTHQHSPQSLIAQRLKVCGFRT